MSEIDKQHDYIDRKKLVSLKGGLILFFILLISIVVITTLLIITNLFGDNKTAIITYERHKYFYIGTEINFIVEGNLKHKIGSIYIFSFGNNFYKGERISVRQLSEYGIVTVNQWFFDQLIFSIAFGILTIIPLIKILIEYRKIKNKLKV